MNLMPHNHLMWANIGIYSGREDNILWRRGSERIDAYSAKALFRGDAVALPADVIHSVTNPLVRFTGGIHIYGGDFFATPRRHWDPETLAEEPSNGEVIRADGLDVIGADLEKLYDTLDGRDLSAGSPLARRLFS